VQADDGVRDMILDALRLRCCHEPALCVEVFAGRKVWQFTGQIKAKEAIDTPVGRFPAVRFEVRRAPRRCEGQARRPRLVSDDERRLPLVAIGEVKGRRSARSSSPRQESAALRRDD